LGGFVRLERLHVLRVKPGIQALASLVHLNYKLSVYFIMETKTIDDDLAAVLAGTTKLGGMVTRMDGSKVFWFTDENGRQHKYATPRPDHDPVELVKQRWRNVRGLDPELDFQPPKKN
jgi:hypothetical protein